MMDVLEILERFGITFSTPETASFADSVIKLGIAMLASWLIFFSTKHWLSHLLERIARRTKSHWDDMLVQHHFFQKLMYIIPPILFNIAVYSIEWQHIWLIKRLVGVWIVISAMFIINTFLNAVNSIYETYEVSRNRPIKAVVQIIKIIVFTVCFIIVISIMVNKSPERLLVGLGAFTAVLMLIFKDTILGFVAGVQLITNRLVTIGDWIVMQNASADGEVLDISLHTVRVQNWDKTIVSIPTYKLFSEPFTNWRGMEESDGRRIKRSIYIDVTSIHFLSEEEINQLKNSALLNKYLNKMIEELDGYKNQNQSYIDSHRLTNIGVFRTYLDQWLESNPDINKQMTHMVRQLQPTPTGIPLEIYCFSAKQAWKDYETVQSDLFDHILAVVPYFNLRMYQYQNKIDA